MKMSFIIRRGILATILLIVAAILFTAACFAAWNEVGGAMISLALSLPAYGISLFLFLASMGLIVTCISREEEKELASLLDKLAKVWE